jgi:GNAT superfamily N-acetyltransferase
MSAEDDYEIVNYDEAKHRNFVFAAFLGALRAHEEFRFVPAPIFYQAFQRAMEHVTAPDSRWKTIVAHVRGGPDDFAGFAIFSQQQIVFWVYVSRPHRRFGLGRMLLEKTGCLRDARSSANLDAAVKPGRVEAKAKMLSVAIRPRDWTYGACVRHGIRVVNHPGELAKVLIGMWWEGQANRLPEFEGWRG